MDTENTKESQQADELLDDSLAPATLGPSPRRAAFEQQLADFEAAAESNPNPLGRALTYVISDTLNIAVTLGDAIRHALPGTPATLEDLERVKGPLNDYFRATRQADRYANFELRMEEIRIRSEDTSQAKRLGGRRPAAQTGGNRHLHGPSRFRE